MARDQKVAPKQDEIELRPDGWDRFRQAVHAAAKSGPKHRAGDPATKQKGRVARQSPKAILRD